MQPEATSVQAGFRYYVSDEQLAAFARLSDLQRLEWVAMALEFSWLGQTDETHLRQQRLRQGQTVCP